jgi:hypothetical protein
VTPGLGLTGGCPGRAAGATAARPALRPGPGGSGRRGGGRRSCPRIRSRWERTVRTLMYSSAAICASVRPWATRVTSSRSRALSPAAAAAVGTGAGRGAQHEGVLGRSVQAHRRAALFGRPGPVRADRLAGAGRVPSRRRDPARKPPAAVAVARRAWRGSVVDHDPADVVACVEVVISLRDLVEPVPGGDQLVELEHAAGVQVDQPGDVDGGI